VNGIPIGNSLPKRRLPKVRRTFNRTRLRVPRCTGMSLAALAGWLNPMITGWFNYYGRYHRSALYAVNRHLNKILVKWARRKYKSLRRHKTRVMQFMEGIARQSPELFAHWRIMGRAGAFV